MSPSAAPAIVAIAAAIGVVLLAPRALDAPPPVVREPVVEAPPEDLAPRPVLAARGRSWTLDVLDDGTATYVETKWSTREDLRFEGPIDPELVPRLRALRRGAGLVTLTSSPSCLRGPDTTPADDYRSSAPRDVHAEAAELTSLIFHDLHQTRILADHVLSTETVVAIARGRAGVAPTVEIDEIVHAGRGQRPPARGTRLRLVDDPMQRRPADDELVVVASWRGNWRVLEQRTPEEARRIFAWLAAHPPTRRPLVEPANGTDERPL